MNNSRIVELLILALKQVCYNQTGLDVTISQIESELATQNQPVVSTDTPTPPTA